MLYRVVVPVLPAQVREATLDRWLVDEGQLIDFGAPVCDLVVGHNYTSERRTKSSDLATGDLGVRFKAMDTDMRLRIISSDRGYLRRCDRRPGDEVVEGDLLGIAASSLDDEIDDSADLTFRLLAELVPRADTLEDEDYEEVDR